jgi:hypothetical protein
MCAPIFWPPVAPRATRTRVVERDALAGASADRDGLVGDAVEVVGDAGERRPRRGQRERDGADRAAIRVDACPGDPAACASACSSRSSRCLAKGIAHRTISYAAWRAGSPALLMRVRSVPSGCRCDRAGRNPRAPSRRTSASVVAAGSRSPTARRLRPGRPRCCAPPSPQMSHPSVTSARTMRCGFGNQFGAPARRGRSRRAPAGADR